MSHHEKHEKHDHQTNSHGKKENAVVDVHHVDPVAIAPGPVAAVAEVAAPIEEETPPTELSTVGFDSRFPNVNQTRNCWQNYVDHHKCVKHFSEEESVCKILKRAASDLCPTEWTEKWDEQREAGIFPVKDLNN